MYKSDKATILCGYENCCVTSQLLAYWVKIGRNEFVLSNDRSISGMLLKFKLIESVLFQKFVFP